MIPGSYRREYLEGTIVSEIDLVRDIIESSLGMLAVLVKQLSKLHTYYLGKGNPSQCPHTLAGLFEEVMVGMYWVDSDSQSMLHYVAPWVAVVWEATSSSMRHKATALITRHSKVTKCGIWLRFLPSYAPHLSTFIESGKKVSSYLKFTPV